MDPIAIFALVYVFTLICCYLFFQGKIKLLRSQLIDLNSQNNTISMELAAEKSKTDELNRSLQRVIANLSVEQERSRNLSDKIKEFDAFEDRQIKQFENLANRVIQEQSNHFIKQQNKGMSDILSPLKEKIKSFEDRVEKSAIDSVKQHESLKEQIKSLSDKSEKVSADANNLAKALKGDFKKQGHWGELILESILSKSGLEKGREYFTQVSEKSDNGKIQRPDVIIDLPDGKVLVVDSKVSLSAYSDLVNSNSEEEQQNFRKLHLTAVKNHIDTLSAKRYQDLYKIESPDFVLMFIPIDTAFSVALEYETDLYNYAFDKNIVIVTSSTLLATLKTVETMWRNAKQNRYALNIASEAGKMYDKFVGFLEDMKKLGNQLGTISNTYNDTMKKLSTGTGNLIGRAEKIKDLGAKASKKISNPKGSGNLVDLDQVLD